MKKFYWINPHDEETQFISLNKIDVCVKKSQWAWLTLTGYNNITSLNKSDVYVKKSQWKEWNHDRRNDYLNKLISKKNNGMIKIITGIRRCGKSYLLDPIFKNYLTDVGVDENHIIKIDLEIRDNIELINPDNLYNYVKNKIIDNEIYYILIDEIQKVPDFESVLNSFLKMQNLDVYVTGSNSKFLSSDIITEFRGRGDEVRIFPLSFKEFYNAYQGDKHEAWNDYILYGGMPVILNIKDDKQKSKYLLDLFELTYKRDIIERNNTPKNL